MEFRFTCITIHILLFDAHEIWLYYEMSIVCPYNSSDYNKTQSIIVTYSGLLILRIGTQNKLIDSDTKR